MLRADVEGELKPGKRGRKIKGWQTKKATEAKKRKRNAQQECKIQIESATKELGRNNSSAPSISEQAITFSLYMHYFLLSPVYSSSFRFQMASHLILYCTKNAGNAFIPQVLNA